MNALFIGCTAGSKSFLNSSDASTGTLFSGQPIRKYSGPRKFQTREVFLRMNDASTWLVHDKNASKRRKWAVVTTIFAPSEAVNVAAHLKEWCLVIVGDIKTPSDYLTLVGLEDRPEVVFLSIDAQCKLHNDFVQLMPFRSFGRKNIGYLYAIHHGAQIVFDFDDDNILKPQDEKHQYRLSLANGLIRRMRQ